MLDQKKFGTLRAIFWPVYRSEVKKVVSMLILLFLLCICHNILRNLKDTIVLTAKNSGAEVIPFLKVWGILPGAIAATWCYTRLARRFSREAIFYIVVSSFIAYFLLFVFVIHPNSEMLHLNALGDFLSQHLPVGFKGLISMIRNWTFTSFYIISELWAVVVLGVLFWGFANDITEVSQAKRTYGILNIGSNIAPMLGGGVGILCARLFPTPMFSTTEEAWSQTVVNTVVTLTILAMLAMVLFYWIRRSILEKKETETSPTIEKETREKFSIRQSIRYISKSKYLTCLAFIMLGYNISINVTDVLWKEQLKRFFTNPNDMLEHMNQVMIGVGLVATLGGSLFSLMVNRLGWTFVAILTPAVMAIMAVGFFIFLFCGDALTAFAWTLFGTGPFALTVYFGSLQNCLSKGGKYSVFDASKELAFLPLDAESRLKGKAAIDGLGAGIGKSGASLAYQGLIILFGSVAASTPYIAILLLFVLSAWISSVIRLGGFFKRATVPQEQAS